MASDFDSTGQDRLLAEGTKPTVHTQEELDSARHKNFIRAIYAEFLGTFLFFSSIMGILANSYQQGWNGQTATFAVVSGCGLTLICTIMCFSSLSGAILNPAITTALWATGKISNRKCLAFFIAQLLASMAVVVVIYGAFPDVDHGLLRAISVVPPSNASLGNIFLSEFITTFLLTFVAFAMAFEEAENMKAASMSVAALEENEGLLMYSSTPQSKAGFAPFAIGFVLMGMALYSGGSGSCMNPARLFGPAVFSGVWDKCYMYWLGEFIGAVAAGLLVEYGPQSASRSQPNPADRMSVIPGDFRKSLSRLSVVSGARNTGPQYREVNNVVNNNT
jgi:glycerol uptake facilitator-like aquaporin